MMYPPPVVSMTEPLMPSSATALSTCAGDGWLANVTVNSVPPAKSMPSRNPFRHIDRMPGMMMTSERAKKRLRRPMMLRRRGGLTSATGSGFGAGAGAAAAATGSSSSVSSGPMSAACSSCLTSDISDTDHSQQSGAAEAAAGENDGQQVVRDDDRGNQAR